MADVVLWQSIRVAVCVLVLFYVITVEEIENREEQKMFGRNHQKSLPWCMHHASPRASHREKTPAAAIL